MHPYNFKFQCIRDHYQDNDQHYHSTYSETTRDSENGETRDSDRQIQERAIKYDQNLYINSKAEWVLNSEHVESAIFEATAKHPILPKEIVKMIATYLQNKEILESLSFFGPGDWAATFHKKVEVIKPPPELDAFLLKRNPFTSKTNAESCLCVFVPSHFQDIPESVNNPMIPLTPSTIEELALKPDNIKNQSRYAFFPKRYGVEKFRHLHSNNSYWVLMTKDITPDSERGRFVEQEFIKKGANEGWEIPSLREVPICAFAHHAKTGIKILKKTTSEVIYTRTVEDFFVGCFSEEWGEQGLFVTEYVLHSPKYKCGIVAIRRFAS